MQSILNYVIGIAVLLLSGVIAAFLMLLNIIKQEEKRKERGKDNDNNWFYRLQIYWKLYAL